MRPHPRLRKTAKWAGVVVCVAIAASFLATPWQQFGLQYGLGPSGNDPWLSAICARRALWLTFAERVGVAYHDGLGGVWTRPTVPTRDEWRPRAVIEARLSYLVVPLWIPFLLTAIPTAFLWRRDRILTKRARAGRCPTCGYDLSGLAAATPCPECGPKPG